MGNFVELKWKFNKITIVVTYEIRVFFEGAQKEVFSSFFKKHYKNTKAWKLAFVSSIFLKAQKNVKYAYVWIKLRVCHYYENHILDKNSKIKKK